jgi:N-acetylneuraminate lyase
MDSMVGLPIKKNGIYAALFSPYDDKGKLDLQQLKRMVQFEVDHGVEGFYCCGSSGEGLLLDIDERKTLVEIVALEIAGKVPFIVHTGSLSTRNAIELSEHAQKYGAAAVSMIPPIYYHYSAAEVSQYYEDVIKNVDIGVIVYNIPQFTGISFSKNNELLQNPRIEGIKHTSMNLYDLERIAQAFPEKIMFNGFDEIWLYSQVAGATATIGTTVNICPKLFSAIRTAFSSGRMEDARMLQHKLNDFIEVLISTSVLPAAKYCLTLQGIDVGSCRRPFLPLTDEQMVQVQAAKKK